MTIYLVGFGIVLLLTGIIWFIRRNLKKHPNATIIISMATLIFLITVITIIKTYMDYKRYLADALSDVVFSTVSFALFLDFSILLIGGLFLYLANQLYLTNKLTQKMMANAHVGKKNEDIKNED